MSRVLSLASLAVVLVRPRFPENIGMAARACANMGVRQLILVAPERWEKEKAAPLATRQGLAVLDSVRVYADLGQALAPFTRAYGATARTGGWRRGVRSAGQAGPLIAEQLCAGETTALVFGPEDRGLENNEIELCSDLITIATAPGASSLNLAQAVLIVLHECFSAVLGRAFHPDQKPRGKKSSRPATLEEREILFAAMRRALSAIGFLDPGNPEWFMLPLRAFFHRGELQRHEFDLFMGVCRRMEHCAAKAAEEKPE